MASGDLVNKFSIEGDPASQAGVASAVATMKAQKDASLKQLLRGQAIQQAQSLRGQYGNETPIAVDENGVKIGEDNAIARAIQQQNADTQEKYRQDQVKGALLKTLLGGGVAGGEKPLGSEQQKASNLIDTARNSLNTTEAIAQKNPKTTAAQTLLQNIPKVGDPLSNLIAGVAGGPWKEFRDSKASTKEAMQNAYTGAAASGEQIPAFQGWAGPGALDILKGNTDTSAPVRDAMNSLQNGLQRSQKSLDPLMVKAAGLENDPIARQVMMQQQQAQMQNKEKALKALSPEDRSIYDEIQRNPTHPNAGKYKQKLMRRYGSIF